MFMRLYYMTQLEIFEEFIVPDQRLRISTFDNVNDPFELLGAINGGKAAHRKFAWLRQHWSETQGFISFSESWGSPLMWAHYARNHTGVCLGIEVSNGKAMKMDYKEKRIALEFDFGRFENAADDDLLKKITATKFQEWSYEREWRILLPLTFDPKTPRPQFFYESFTPEFELREVILGARCEKTPQEVASQIFGATSVITVKRARPAFLEFKMVEQKRSRPAFVNPLADFSRKERNAAAELRRRAASSAERKRKDSLLF